MNDVHLFQKSLKQRIGCVGTGLHTGRRSALNLTPAPDHHGIVIRQQDRGHSTSWAVDLHQLDAQGEDLVLRSEAGRELNVSGLMVALAHADIDHAIIDLSGPELPFMNGSAQPFAFLIECAGIQISDQAREIRPFPTIIETFDGDQWVKLEPADQTLAQIGGSVFNLLDKPLRHHLTARRPMLPDDYHDAQLKALEMPGFELFRLAGSVPTDADEQAEAEAFAAALTLAAGAMMARQYQLQITMNKANPALLLRAWQEAIPNTSTGAAQRNQRVQSRP